MWINQSRIGKVSASVEWSFCPNSPTRRSFVVHILYLSRSANGLVDSKVDRDYCTCPVLYLAFKVDESMGWLTVKQTVIIVRVMCCVLRSEWTNQWAPFDGDVAE